MSEEEQDRLHGELLVAERKAKKTLACLQVRVRETRSLRGQSAKNSNLLGFERVFGGEPIDSSDTRSSELYGYQ